MSGEYLQGASERELVGFKLFSRSTLQTLTNIKPEIDVSSPVSRNKIKANGEGQTCNNSSTQTVIGPLLLAAMLHIKPVLLSCNISVLAFTRHKLDIFQGSSIEINTDIKKMAVL